MTMMNQNIYDDIEKAVGKRPFTIKPLSGGCVGEVIRIDFQDNETLVGKIGNGSNSSLSIEGNMLDYLNRHTKLPVPRVIHNSDQLLIMTFIEGNDPIDYHAAQDAAKLLADLHRINAPQFGFDYPTLIGGLHQPNAKNDSWIDFFAQERLLYMAKDALNASRISSKLMSRIEAFVGDLHRFIAEPVKPSLLHGDIWGGNVIVQDGKISGFIDPAIYFGHPEIELAFITLFSTFGSEFFNAYDEDYGVEPGFFTERRDIYNLYPLLVHSRLFGGHYPFQVESTLKRFGY